MTKRMLLSVVAGAALAAGAAARAAEAPATPPQASETPGPGWRSGPYQGLDLSADQQKRLTDLRATTNRKLFAVREEMFRKASELRQLWAAQDPDANAIRAKQAELNQLRDQMATTRTDQHLAALEILTPAQREKLEAWGGRGFGGGFGPGGHGPGMRGRGRGMDEFGHGMGGFGPGRGRGTGSQGSGFGGRGPGWCGMGGGWQP